MYLQLVASCLTLSGMKTMCTSADDAAVVVGAALFGEECHFPRCNYIHRSTRDVVCDS